MINFCGEKGKKNSERLQSVDRREEEKGKERWIRKKHIKFVEARDEV